MKKIVAAIIITGFFFIPQASGSMESCLLGCESSFQSCQAICDVGASDISFCISQCAYAYRSCVSSCRP